MPVADQPAVDGSTTVLVHNQSISNHDMKLQVLSDVESVIDPSLRSSSSAFKTQTVTSNNAAITPALDSDAGIAALMSKIKELEGKFRST